MRLELVVKIVGSQGWAVLGTGDSYDRAVFGAGGRQGRAVLGKGGSQG